MPKIQLLDEQTIDQIAAGEVVERPSSVVKELVENAIDAGATAIHVEIRDGGTTRIRVTDNGCGIDADQIRAAFCRHSTSKIRSLKDLSTIASLGFRGEALSSIASVAQVELITKTADSLTGSRYLLEGGREDSLTEIGAPNGTTFLVNNLFYNTPARKKFLKTPQTEAAHIGDLMERIALSHPEISFQYENNGQTRLHTSGNGRLLDVIYAVYGKEAAANVLEVNGEFDTFSVYGFVGKPNLSRGNRNFESCFINGRYIKSSLISKAIEDAYHGFLMQHRFPFAVLHLRVDGELVDVNVHPNKMELRFSNGQEMYRQLRDLIRRALSERELIADVSVNEEPGKGKNAARPAVDKKEIPEPFEEKRRAKTAGPAASQAREPLQYGAGELPASAKAAQMERSASADSTQMERSASADSEQMELSDFAAENPPTQSGEASPGRNEEASSLREEEVPPLLSEEARAAHRVIGQLFNTYWLVEYADRFYMIDQHAAHEKVLYEETMRNYHQKEFTSQMVSPPILLTVSLQEEELLTRYQSAFEQLGFVIEPFGGKEYAVRAVPDNLYGLDGEELLKDLVDELGSVTEQDTPELVAEKIASMSCKAAVKGNQRLSRAEVDRLIDDLLKLENPYFCPHGRPVIVSMTRQEIEKKFKRIV